MEIYRNRIRREYLKRRSLKEMVVGTIVVFILLFVVAASCSFGSDVSIPDLEAMLDSEAFALEKSGEDLALAEMFGWDEDPAVMAAHMSALGAVEVIVTIDGEPELVSIVK